MKNKIRIPTLLPPLGALAAALLFSNASANAETFSTAPGVLEWTNNVNWLEGTVPNAVGATGIFIDPASADTFASLAGSIGTSGITVGSLQFNKDANPGFITFITNGVNGGPLTFDNGGAGSTITISGVGTPLGSRFAPVNTMTATMVFKDTVTVFADNLIGGAGDGNVSLRGVISGPGGFTKAGDGLAGFSAASGGGPKSYSGPTVINAGRMRTSVTGAPTNTSSLTVNVGGQLDITAGGTVRFGPGPLILNGTGALNPPYNTAMGAMRNERGTTITNIVILNDVILQSDSLIHIQSLNATGESDSPKGTNTLAGTVSGSGKLTFTAPGSNRDAGVLVLKGHNTYSGGTLVSGGILQALDASATFGTGDVTVDNAEAPAAIARISVDSSVLDAIADTATLSMVQSIAAGTTFPSGYAILSDGVNEYIAALNLDGIAQPLGTYGSSLSSAANKNDTFFRGTGIVTVGAKPPTLTITLAAPNVIISWPTNNSAGFTLEKTANLNSPITWSPVTQPVIVSGSNNTVTVPVAAGNVFYRLRKP
ncbi:MAG: autotransporter-associated beta strand repeat-containing protein [Verrucomicrobiota bacterium]